MSNIASKDDIRNWGKRKLYDFTSSDGTITAKLQQMNAIELRRMLKSIKANGNDMTRPSMIAISVVNEEGNRIFGDDDIEMIEREFSLAAIAELGECIEAHNGMGEKAKEEAEGNSFATLS